MRKQSLEKSPRIIINGANGLPIQTVAIFITVMGINTLAFGTILYDIVVRDSVGRMVKQRK